MAPGYFLFGFTTAVAIIAAIFIIAHYFQKHTRRKYSNIKGYLDLIPDLTEEQRRKVQDIRRSFLPRVERIRQDLCRKRELLARELFAEAADKSRVHGVAQDILKSQSELEHEVIEHILEEKEILTPQQQKRFYDIILQQFSHGGLGVHDVRGRKG